MPAGKPTGSAPTVVTDVSARRSVLLGPGQSATFGRVSASTSLDFRLHDSRSLSRRAGQIEVREGGGVAVRSTQRDDCGGVSVLAPSGTPVATLAYGSEFTCLLPEFRVRVRVDGVGYFDLQVTHDSQQRAPSADTTSDPDRTQAPPWVTGQVLDPPPQLRWQTALAIACVLTAHGPPQRPSADAWSGELPTSGSVLRWVNVYLGTSFGAHWLSDRWDQANSALGMPRSAGGADKLPALVREVLATKRVSDELMLAVLERLRALPG